MELCQRAANHRRVKRSIFKGADPRDYINPKSPAYKAMGLKGKALTPDQALGLMAEEPNLI